MYRFSLLILCLLPALVNAANPWEQFQSPAAQSPESVGSYANGCLLGGEAMPADGKGYQIVRLSRHRYYGHPLLLQYLQDLGEKVAKNKLGLMLIADMSMPRGGPFTTGHRSHQTGLDADIWLPLNYHREKGNRDDLKSIEMVDHDRFSVDRRFWTKAQEKLIKLAAEDQRVARIFVHPAIKTALCKANWSDRSWLNKVRPWWGHDSHFHVRLNCPASASNCKPQEAPESGDGCGAELASWYPENQPDKPVKHKPKPKPPLPTACQALLQTRESH